MTQKSLTPLRAIRAKCLDCSGWSTYEVKSCPMVNCPLYGYRDGHNPKRKGIGNKHIDERIKASRSVSE